MIAHEFWNDGGAKSETNYCTEPEKLILVMLFDRSPTLCGYCVAGLEQISPKKSQKKKRLPEFSCALFHILLIPNLILFPYTGNGKYV